LSSFGGGARALSLLARLLRFMIKMRVLNGDAGATPDVLGYPQVVLRVMIARLRRDKRDSAHCLAAPRHRHAYVGAQPHFPQNAQVIGVLSGALQQAQ
jgi:hypothetical protein